MSEEVKEQKVDNSQVEDNKDSKGGGHGIVIVLVLLIFVALGALFYVLFFYEEEEPEVDIVDVALEMRRTTLGLTVKADEEASLDDYSSMASTNALLKGNTCEDEVQVEPSGGWARNWFYLIIGDMLYYEMTGEDDDDYVSESKILLDSFENQYSVSGDYGLGRVRGRSFYCVPFLVFRDFREDRGNAKYEESYSVARDLCYQSYIDNDSFGPYTSGDICGEADCVSDYEFYDELEKLFSVDLQDFEAEEIKPLIEDADEDVWMHPLNVFGDYYILGFLENDYTDIIEVANSDFIYGYQGMLKDGVDSSIDICVSRQEYFLDLYELLLLKGHLIEDSELQARHDEVEEKFISTCYGSKKDFFEEAIEIFSLADLIELQNLVEDDSEFKEMFSPENYLSEEVEDVWFSKYYQGEEYLFFNYGDILDSSDECESFRMTIKDYPKYYFYLLLSRAYENE